MTPASTASPPVADSTAGRQPQPARPWRPKFTTVALVLPVVFMALVYAYPVGGMLLRAFTEPEPGLGNFTRAAADPVVWQALWVTVRISLEVAVLTVVLGFPVAYFLSGASPRLTRVLLLLVVIPFWTSVLVRSFAWMVLLGDNGVVTSLLAPITGDSDGLLYSEAAVVVALTHILLPFPILIIKGTLDQIDGSLVRAARTLGAGPVRAFTGVYLPLAIPAAISSAMLVFVIGLGFYVTPALVGGPKESTIAVVIAQSVQVTFDWGMAAALAALLLVVAVLLTVVVRKLTKVKGLVSL
ncbi:ABC transporter permease [Actinosynnema sp. CS-041913]|uniref:ABC transporter permease n=1 Tax=Actinosynnema sp. CS-041913 TaxID=3239917 RepID=UPI003D919CF8